MIVNKPPMGWNSWNTFGENINEALIMETADVMAKEGYKDAGYEYVIIDDCWSLRQRDENGRLVADSEKFPHGMKYLADYIHSKGLKFGMYSCSGILTCAHYPGSFGHEYDDAATFAEWGVDYLKYDHCMFPTSADARNAYLTMSMALRSCGRDILFAACNWGVGEPWTWMRSIGAHTYRSTGDIQDNFRSFTDIMFSQEEKFSMSAPSCFNDIDMLTVGMYGNGLVGLKDNICTDAEYKLQFSLWALYSAPLIKGGDIRNMNEYCKKLMLNSELIEINQDGESRPPIIVNKYKQYDFNNDYRVLFKLLDNNEYVLFLANYMDKPYSITVSFADLGIPYSSKMALDLHDVYTGEKFGLARDFVDINVASHDCVMLRGRLVNA